MISVLFALAGIGCGLGLFSLAFTLWINRRFPANGSPVPVDGAEINLVDLPGPNPNSQALVLIHGASGTLRDPLNAIGTTLVKQFRVVAIDRPGQGHSRRWDPALSDPARQADAICQVLDHLEVERAILVGHSWGGAVAAAFAVRHKDRVAGLVLLSAVSHPWPGGIGFRNRFGALPVIGPLLAWMIVVPAGMAMFRCALRKIFGPKQVPTDYARITGAKLALKPSAFIANCQDVASLFDNLLRLSVQYDEIKTPVEIVTGDEDAILAPFVHSYGLARDISGARMTVLSGVGHMPHWSDTDAVLGAIDRVTSRVGDVACQPEPRDRVGA